MFYRIIKMGKCWNYFDDGRCNPFNENLIFLNSTQYVYNLFYEKNE